MRTLLTGLFAAVVLATAAPAFAAPPPNDDRANAAPIPTFPATLTGTTVEATIERLDPQVSQCGQIEATSWYSITQSPDGTIELGVQGAGLTPVIRVYRQRPSGIAELDCATAPAGQRAQIAFESVRGAGFLVIVGKKPGTGDSDFTLDAALFLPPPNDSARSAQPIRNLPATVKATTLGATTEATDPKTCGLVGGTVWYTVAPGAASRFVLRMHAQGDLDASVVVREKVRSQTENVACGKTDKKGNAIVAVDVQKGAQYLVAVGQRQDSSPGAFTLEVLAAQAAEQAPGLHLAAAGVHSTVNGLTDVNDVYWAQLTEGTTYRVGFSSRGCPTLYVRSLKTKARLGEIECGGYGSFTPGPDGGGRYTFEIVAPGSTVTVPYRLQVAAAGEDDVGVGLEIRNLGHVTGSLGGVDVIDLYHFDVDRTADVRLALGGGHGFSLVLATDDGGRVSSGGSEIHRSLGAGRYVVAVKAPAGAGGGRYSLSLVIRQLTATSISASSTSIGAGSSVTFRAVTGPTPDGGVTTIQIDRFDPFGGWQFVKIVRVSGSGGSVTWAPPGQGRWRARAAFAGTLQFSPSRSGYVVVEVKTPTG